MESLYSVNPCPFANKTSLLLNQCFFISQTRLLCNAPKPCLR